MQAVDIASRVKVKVASDLEALVHRDRKLLAEVCTELGLLATPVNMTQVMVAMRDLSLATHEEYPKMVYPDGDGKPGVIVNNQVEEKATLHPAKPAPEHKAPLKPAHKPAHKPDHDEA